jgi:hypothetical protein
VVVSAVVGGGTGGVPVIISAVVGGAGVVEAGGLVGLDLLSPPPPPHAVMMTTAMRMASEAVTFLMFMWLFPFGRWPRRFDHTAHKKMSTAVESDQNRKVLTLSNCLGRSNLYLMLKIISHSTHFDNNFVWRLSLQSK